MNASQELYVIEAKEMLEKLIQYDREGYYNEGDVKGQITFIINHLKKGLK